jgi:hypothetical protein
MLPAALVCAFLTVPMALSFDPVLLGQARLALTTLAATGVTEATVATSSWKFTYEFFALARELDQPRLANFRVDTLVLDYEDNLPLDASLAKLRRSQAAIFEMPLPTWPGYLNAHAQDYFAAAQANGTAVAGIPDGLAAFVMRPGTERPAPAPGQ